MATTEEKPYGIVERYMDGNAVVGKLEVCLKDSAWSDFKDQPFYREMIQYLNGENAVPEVKEEKRVIVNLKIKPNRKNEIKDTVDLFESCGVKYDELHIEIDFG